MAKKATDFRIWWGAAAALLAAVVTLSLGAAGQGPLASLGDGARPFIQPLFILGAAVAGVSGFRQFLSGFEGRPTGTRIVIGLAIGLVGAACFALLVFSLILGAGTAPPAP